MLPARRARRPCPGRWPRPAPRRGRAASCSAAEQPLGAVGRRDHDPVVGRQTRRPRRPERGAAVGRIGDVDDRHLDRRSAPERCSERDQRRRLLAGPGDHDPRAEQRAATRTRPGRAAATSPITIVDRRLERLVGEGGRAWPARCAARGGCPSGPRRPACRGRARRPAAGPTIFGRRPTPMRMTIVPPSRATVSQSSSPPLSGSSWPVMTVNERRRVAHRDRDAGVGGGGDGRRDAGHDLEGHAGREQGAGLLAAAGEHERIAALEAHDLLAPPAALDQQRVDLRPGASWPGPGALPTLMRSAPRRRQVEQAGDREPVVDDDVGAAEHLGAPHGQQPGITGSGTHQVDGHRSSLGSPPEAGSRRCSGR